MINTLCAVSRSNTLVSVLIASTVLMFLNDITIQACSTSLLLESHFVALIIKWEHEQPHQFSI